MDSREVIVIGAGPAGLGVAGRLARHGIQSQILERSARIGESWRRRYDSLRLNTVRHLSDLPGYRMERQFGSYPSRDEFIAYLERYVCREGLTIRYDTPVRRIDRAERGWSVILDNDEVLCARRVILATGYDAKPFLPAWPGLHDFTGTLMHACAYTNSRPFAGQDVLVVGAGNTASDIATDLGRSTAKRVRVSIRTPPNIFPRKLFGGHAQYGAILGEQLPGFADRIGFVVQRILYGDLTPHGLPRPAEGMHTHFRHSGHGPMVDDGFVELVKAGVLEIVPAVAGFEGADVRLVNGRRIRPEVVVAATGYARDLGSLVGHLGVLAADGSPIVDKARCPHDAPGLYFIGFVRKMGGQLWPMRGEAKQIARELSAELRRERRVHRARRPGRRCSTSIMSSGPSQQLR